MTLSEWQAIRDSFNKIDKSTHLNADRILLQETNAVIEELHLLSNSIADDLSDAIRTKKDMFVLLMNDINNHLMRNIEDRYSDYYKKGDAFEQHHDRKTYEEWQEFSKMLYYNTDQLYKLSEIRIGLYSSWQKSSMIFHMDSFDNFTQVLGSYPIYYVDKWKGQHSKLTREFNQSQMRKIRFYDQDSLDMFPKQAIHLAVSRNHFTHVARARLINELQWISAQLIPGGVIAFNFNDCEYTKCTKLVELDRRTFQLGTDVRQILTSLGLEVVNWQYLDDSETVWVEAQKPGHTISIKRGETLGVVTQKS